MKLLSRHYCVKIICRLKENKALFNNINLSTIEYNLNISKNYTIKQKHKFFEEQELDIDKIEYYYPIVKKIDEIYYKKSFFDKIMYIINSVLFIINYILS